MGAGTGVETRVEIEMSAEASTEKYQGSRLLTWCSVTSTGFPFLRSVFLLHYFCIVIPANF